MRHGLSNYSQNKDKELNGDGSAGDVSWARNANGQSMARVCYTSEARRDVVTPGNVTDNAARLCSHGQQGHE